MIALTVTPDIDAAPWSDCADIKQMGEIARIGRLTCGTTGGQSTVSVLVTLPDGRRVIAQTTLQLLTSAVAVLNAAELRDRHLPAGDD